MCIGIEFEGVSLGTGVENGRGGTVGIAPARYYE